MIDIEAIKKDDGRRNSFIESYKPFIASSVCSIIGRRVEYGTSDELQIALIAFNHAINSFDGRGSFLNFAKLVIKNRLYDYFRVNKKYNSDEPIFDKDDHENYKLTFNAVQKAELDEYTFDLKQEIELLTNELKNFSIEFKDLVKCSPKHKQKRKMIDTVVEFILKDSEARQYFFNTKTLPLKYIEDKLGISRKNIEPYRKYIITLILISSSNYFYLKEYLAF